MDVKIENSDIALCNNGDYMYISGMDEVLQRVKIACSLKKGDFPYDKNLGCYDYTVDMSDELMCEKLSMIFKEATVDVGYSDLQVTQIEQLPNGYKATVKVWCLEQSGVAEVSIYE